MIERFNNEKATKTIYTVLNFRYPEFLNDTVTALSDQTFCACSLVQSGQRNKKLYGRN